MVMVSGSKVELICNPEHPSPLQEAQPSLELAQQLPAQGHLYLSVG